MSLFSSILGGQGATPVGSPQAITTTEIPKQLAPYYTDILSKAQALYNKRVDEGYKPYEGPTIAQYTPEQEATFAGIAGLQGQVAPKFAEAEQMTRDAAGAITGEQLQEAMSPYQQAVTDIEKRESQKAFEQNVLPKLRAAQVAQGSFGGTRGTLLEAQALGDQQRMLGDIQAKGSAAAFKDARAALEAERLRQGQGATQLANLAPASLSNQLKELGAQQTVGETKQRQAQTALDEAYRQFQLEKQEPYDAMSKYQSVVTGAPLGSTQYAQPAPPPPSLGQTLLGGATTAAGLYGAFTGNNPLAAVGLMGKKEGGGLSDLPVIKRAQPGQVFTSLQQSPGEKFADRFGNVMNQQGTGFDKFKSGIYDFFAEAEERRRARNERDFGGIQATNQAIQGRNRSEKEFEDAVKRSGTVPYAITDDMDTFKLRQQLRESDLAGEELARRIAKNKPNLQNVIREGSGESSSIKRDPSGKIINQNTGRITKSKPISKKYKGELQKIFEEREKLKKEKEKENKINKDTNKNLVAQNETKPTGQLSDYEQNIRDKEDAYLKMIAGADKRFTDRAAAAEKQGTKDKYMAVAQLGLDIMGTPSSGNLFTTVATSAKNSKVLEKVQAANQRLQKQRDDLEDKAFAAKTGLAKEELGVELNRKERKDIKEAKDAEKKYKEETLKIAKEELKLKRDEVEATLAASNVSSKDYGAVKNILGELVGKGTNFVTGANGALTFVGKGINVEYDTLIKDAIYDAQIGLAQSRDINDFVTNKLPAVKAKIVNIQTKFPNAAEGKKGEKKNLDKEENIT